MPQISILFFLSGTRTFGGQKWSSWHQYKIRFLKCPKPLLYILAAFVCFCGLQRLLILAGPTFLLSKFSVSKKNEKRANFFGWFLITLIMKCAILGLNTSSLLPSNSLSPVLTNFMTYPFLPLSATLTQFETSVQGGGGCPPSFSRFSPIFLEIPPQNGQNQIISNVLPPPVLEKF